MEQDTVITVKNNRIYLKCYKEMVPRCHLFIRCISGSISGGISSDLYHIKYWG